MAGNSHRAVQHGTSNDSIDCSYSRRQSQLCVITATMLLLLEHVASDCAAVTVSTVSKRVANVSPAFMQRQQSVAAESRRAAHINTYACRPPTGTAGRQALMAMLIASAVCAAGTATSP